MKEVWGLVCNFTCFPYSWCHAELSADGTSPAEPCPDSQDSHPCQVPTPTSNSSAQTTITPRASAPSAVRMLQEQETKYTHLPDLGHKHVLHVLVWFFSANYVWIFGIVFPYIKKHFLYVNLSLSPPPPLCCVYVHAQAPG